MAAKVVKPEPKLRRRILSLLRRHKIPYHAKQKEMWYDGKAIAAGLHNELDILHEAGHWIAAKHRKVVNYGLGPDPDNETPKEIESPELVEDTQGAEEIASALGILLTEKVKGDTKAHLDYHNWQSEKTTKCRKDLLTAKKIAEKAGIRIPSALVDRVCGFHSELWDKRMQKGLGNY